MNTKNFISVLSLAIGLLVSATFFVACGGDSDENKETESIIVGEWSGPRYDGSGKKNDNRLLILIFKSDGSGTYVEQDDDYKDSGVFNYIMEGSHKGKIRFDDNILYDYYFMINGKNMTICDKGYGEDIDWVLTKK